MPDHQSLTRPSLDLPCPFTLPLFPEDLTATAEPLAKDQDQGHLALTFKADEASEDGQARPIGPSDRDASRCTAPQAPEWVRVVREPGAEDLPRMTIRKPTDAVRLIRRRSDAELVEVFYVITLNATNDVTACQEVTRGLLNSSLCHPREVFRLAILRNAAAIILAHNHPSGNPTPSAEDRAITHQLVEAGRILDIPVADHVIVTPDKYFSFTDAGLL